MGNYWLELLKLETTADELQLFLTNQVRGRKYLDPRNEVKKLLISFFSKYPELSRFEHFLDVEAKIVKNQDGSYYIATIIVNIHD